MPSTSWKTNIYCGTLQRINSSAKVQVFLALRVRLKRSLFRGIREPHASKKDNLGSRKHRILFSNALALKKSLSCRYVHDHEESKTQPSHGYSHELDHRQAVGR